MIEEIRGLPETKKLIRLGLLALLVWTAGTAFFLEASSILNSSKDRVMDTGKILMRQIPFTRILHELLQREKSLCHSLRMR